MNHASRPCIDVHARLTRDFIKRSTILPTVILLPAVYSGLILSLWPNFSVIEPRLTKLLSLFTAAWQTLAARRIQRAIAKGSQFLHSPVFLEKLASPSLAINCQTSTTSASTAPAVCISTWNIQLSTPNCQTRAPNYSHPISQSIIAVWLSAETRAGLKGGQHAPQIYHTVPLTLQTLIRGPRVEGNFREPRLDTSQKLNPRKGRIKSDGRAKGAISQVITLKKPRDIRAVDVAPLAGAGNPSSDIEPGLRRRGRKDRGGNAVERWRIRE